MLWLSGWVYRKNHLINPAAGAGAGYQVKVIVHYGAGSDSGEDVYCNSLCRADFGDIRFTDDSDNPLDYWLQSKTDSDHAVFWVEIAGSLEATAQTVYVYYGKSNAATTSNQAATFIDVISGVAGAWNMEEANATDPVLDYSRNSNTGTPTGTTMTTGKFAGKNARQFNGSSDYISRTNTASLGFSNPVITFGGLFYINALPTSTYAYFMSRYNDGFRLGIDPTGHVVGMVYVDSAVSRGGVSSSAVVSAGNWYAIFLTFDGSNVNIYVNSATPVYTQTGSAATVFSNYANAWNFGRASNGTKYVNANISFMLISPSIITGANAANIASNYPDVTLDAGKVLVRKWATSSQPSHDVWGSVEHFVAASDLVSAADGVLRDKRLDVSDSVGAEDALLGYKELLLSDSVGALEGLSALKSLLVGDVVGLTDLFLVLKGLGVADSVCLADGLAVNKALRIAEDVFVAEAVDVGSGDRRTRLFLILGNVAVELTKNA